MPLLALFRSFILAESGMRGSEVVVTKNRAILVEGVSDRVALVS